MTTLESQEAYRKAYEAVQQMEADIGEMILTEADITDRDERGATASKVREVAALMTYYADTLDQMYWVRFIRPGGVTDGD